MGSTARGETKYRPLVAYLAAQRAPEVVCTFAHIEGIVGFPLPRTARTVTGFWTDRLRSHVRAWEAISWYAHLDFPNRRVIFRRDAGGERTSYRFPQNMDSAARATRNHCTKEDAGSAVVAVSCDDNG